MDSVVEDFPTLPVDFDASANPDHLAEVTFGANVVKMTDGTVGMVEKASSGRMSPVRARTMKEYDQEITELKKENFSLKLRIYFLEEKVQQRHGDDADFKTTIELKIQVESLKKDLMDKQELLKTASNAMDSLSIQHQEVQEKLQETEQEVENYRQMLSDTENELKELKDQGSTATLPSEETEKKILQLTSDLQQRDAVIESLRGSSDDPSSGRVSEAQRSLEEKLLHLQRELEERGNETKILEDQLGKERESHDQVIRDLKERLQASEQRVHEFEIVADQMTRDSQMRVGDIDKLEGMIRSKDEENKELQSELETAQKELDGEKTNGVKYQKTIQGLLMAVQDVKKQKEELAAQVATFELELEKSQQQAHQAQMGNHKKVEDNQSALNDKDDKILDLEHKLGQQEVDVKKLEKSVQQKEAELAHLKDQLGQSEKLVKSHDDNEQQLRDQLQEERRKNAETVETLDKNYQTFYADSQRQLQNQEKIVQRLTNSLRDKDRQLQEYMDMVTNDDGRSERDVAHDKMVRSLQDRLKEKDRALEVAYDEKFAAVEDRDSEITKLKMMLRERDHDLERANHMMLTSENTIDSQNQEIKDKDKYIKELVNSLTSLQSAMDEAGDTQQRTLEEKDSIVRRLKQALASKDEQLQEALDATPRRDDLDLQRQLRQKDRLLEEAIAEKGRVALENEKATRELLNKLTEKDGDMKEQCDHLNQEITRLTKEGHWLRSEMHKKEFELQMAVNRVMWGEDQAKDTLEKMRSALVEKDKTIETLIDSVRDKDKLIAEMKDFNISGGRLPSFPMQQGLLNEAASLPPGHGRKRMGRRASMPSMTIAPELHKLSRSRRGSVQLAEICQDLSVLRENLEQTAAPSKPVNRRLSISGLIIPPSLESPSQEGEEHMQGGGDTGRLMAKPIQDDGTDGQLEDKDGHEKSNASTTSPNKWDHQQRVLEEELAAEKQKNDILKQQLNDLLLTPDGAQAVSSGTVAILKKQLNQANEKVNAKEKENVELRDKMREPSTTNDVENELARLRQQLESSEKTCDQLTQQLNAQTAATPEGFNPELVMQMATEIERLRKELDSNREKLGRGTKGEGTGRTGSDGALRQTRIPTLKKQSQGQKQGTAGAGGGLTSTAAKSRGVGAYSVDGGVELHSQLQDLRHRNKQLVNKVAATEATVRAQADKMKYYRGLLEDAGLMPHTPHRWRSDSNLAGAPASPLRKSRLSASTDNLLVGPLSPPLRGNLGARVFSEFGDTNDSQTLKEQIGQLQDQLERNQRVIKALQRRIRFGSEAERLGFASPLSSRRGSGQLSAMPGLGSFTAVGQDGNIDRVQRENELLQERLAGLSRSNDELQEECATLKEQLDSLSSNKNQLQRECASLKEQLQDLRSKDGGDTDTDELKEQLANAQEEVTHLKEDLRIRFIKDANMEQERDVLKRQLDDSRATVARLRQEGDALSRGGGSTIPPESERGVEGQEGVSAILQNMAGERAEKVMLKPGKQSIRELPATEAKVTRPPPGDDTSVFNQLAQGRQLSEALRSKVDVAQTAVFEMLHQNETGDVDCIDVTPERVTGVKVDMLTACDLADQLVELMQASPAVSGSMAGSDTGAPLASSRDRPQVSVGCSAPDLVDSGQQFPGMTQEPRQHHQGQGREDGDEDSSDSLQDDRRTRPNYPPHRSVEGSLDYLSESSTTSSPATQPRASHASSLFGSRDDVLARQEAGAESPPSGDRKRSRKKAFPRRPAPAASASTSENDDLPRHRTRPKVIGHRHGDDLSDSTENSSRSSHIPARVANAASVPQYGQDSMTSVRSGHDRPTLERQGEDDRQSLRSGTSYTRSQESGSPRSSRGRPSTSSQRAPTLGSQNDRIGQRDPWREIGKLKMRLQNAEDMNRTLGEELRLYENVNKSTIGIQSSPVLGSHGSQTSGSASQTVWESHLEEIRRLRERLEESIAVNDRLREQLEQRLSQSDNTALLTECQDLQRQLYEAHEKLAAAEYQLREDAQQHRDAEQRLRRAELECKDSDKKRRDAELRLKQALRRLSDERQHADQIGGAEHDGDDVRDGSFQDGGGLFTRQLEKLNDELRAQLTRYTDTMQLNEALQDDNDSLRNDLTRRDHALAEAERAAEELRRGLREKDGKLNEMNDVILQAKHQMESLDADNQRMKTEVTECRQRERGQENRVYELEKAAAQKDTINNDLKAQMEHDRKQLMERENKLWDLERELSRKRSEVANRQAKIERLESELDDKQVELSKLESQLSSSQTSLGKVESQLRNQQVVVARLESELRHQQAEVGRLEAELSRSRAALERGDRQLRESQDVAGMDYERKYKELERVNASLNEEVKIARMRNKRLEEELRLVRDNLEEKTELNKTLQVELSVFEQMAPPADGRLIDPATGIDMTTLFEELRRLRITLERSIENNNLLRQRLEEMLAKGSNSPSQRDQRPGDHSPLYRDQLRDSNDPSQEDRHHQRQSPSERYGRAPSSHSQRYNGGSPHRRHRNGVTHHNEGHGSDLSYRSQGGANRRLSNGYYANGSPDDSLHAQDLATSVKGQGPLATDSIHRQYVSGAGDHGNFQSPVRDFTDKNGSGAERLRSGPASQPSWSIRSSPHTTLQSSPGRLTTGHPEQDSLVNLPLDASKYHIMDPPQTIDRSPVKVNTDHRMLYAVGRIDDYELLCKQVNEALVVVKGTAARIGNRLEAFQSISVTEKTKSLEYSTLRELSTSSGQLDRVLKACQRLVRMFWTSQLNLDANSMLSSSQREAFHEQEIMDLKEKLVSLENKYDKLTKQYRVSHKKCEHLQDHITRELSKTENTLRKARANFEEHYLSRTPSSASGSQTG